MTQPVVNDSQHLATPDFLHFIRIACAFTLAGFSLYTAFFGIMSDMIQRSVHLGLVLVLVYLGALVPSSLGQINNRFLRLVSVALAIAGMATMFYQVWFSTTLHRAMVN